MSNDKVKRLQKYIGDLKSRLTREVSPKHKDNPGPIIDWVKREIRKHEAMIEKLTK